MDSTGKASGQASRPYLTAFSMFILSCFLAIILQVFFFSPITAKPLEFPPASSASLLPTNSQLRGSLEFGVDGGTVLASHVNNTKISIASTKLQLPHWYVDPRKEEPPTLNKTSIVLDGLFFDNGVALSMDLDYLVVCQSWKFRCLKYWLSGEGKGKREIFVDNLPGAPDTIKLAPDGSFLITLIQLTSEGLEYIHTSKALKHLVAAFPKLLNRGQGMHTTATVVNVAANGTIRMSFDDPDGKVMSFWTSALHRACYGTRYRYGCAAYQTQRLFN